MSVSHTIETLWGRCLYYHLHFTGEKPQGWKGYLTHQIHRQTLICGARIFFFFSAQPLSHTAISRKNISMKPHIEVCERSQWSNLFWRVKSLYKQCQVNWKEQTELESASMVYLLKSKCLGSKTGLIFVLFTPVCSWVGC